MYDPDVAVNRGKIDWAAVKAKVAVQDKAAAALTQMAEWDEGAHPRDAKGEFKVGDTVHVAAPQSGYIGRFKITRFDPETGFAHLAGGGRQGRARPDQLFRTKHAALASLSIPGGGWGAAAQLGMAETVEEDEDRDG